MNRLSSLVKVFAVAAVAVGGAMAQQGVIFSEDFEGTNSFTIANGSETNKWAVGTATAYGGSKSAYISNDNGTSNAYTTTAASVVYMYRNVTFPSAVGYTLSFNWKGMGDYLRVYLVETSVALTGGTELPSGSSLVGPNPYLQGASDWQQVNVSIPASNSGTTKRLVFTWRNNASGGTNPPIAVDNIVLKALGCTVTQSGATFTITAVGPNTISAAIDTIRTRAQGQDCAIRFGDGTNTLSLGNGEVRFETVQGSSWGWGNITLSGKVTSSSSFTTILVRNDISVESTADIEITSADTNKYAILNQSTKPLIIGGGTISCANGRAIFNNTSAATVNITGGTVSTTSGTAIYGGTVTVSDATISATTGTAISSSGRNITINNSAVSATSGTAISGGPVTINDATISATTGTAIISSNNITINSGRVSGPISATGAASVVTVNGGTVSATGTNVTISTTGANSRVVVTGGEITAVNGRAINTAATGAAVTISGGTVSATGINTTGTGGSAIYADNAGAVVSISGGSVISRGATDAKPTIYMSNAIPTVTGPNVIISGTGSVQNIAASNGYAIRTFGGVSVSDGAQVNANGYAIALEGARVTATISGGTISASGGASTAAINAIGSGVTVLVNGGTVMHTGAGIAVNADGPNGVVFVNGGASGGKVLADDTRIGTTGARVITIERTETTTAYAEGSATDLTVSPEGASAAWAVVGEKSGISYERGTNTGFFEVTGVTVSTPRGDVSESITFTNGSTAYTGSERTYETATNGGFTAGTNPKWTYTYAVGDSPTGNESFSAAGKPVNAGNYSVTVVYDDSNNDGTKTVSFTVTKINPTVIWPTGLLAEAGQTLSEVSLASYTNPSGTAGAFSWTNPTTEVGAAGSRSHSVTFTPTNANYNTMTQNVTVMVSVSTAVLSPDRVVPQSKPNEEATVVAPAVVLSGEFTAGPNPVAKQSGIVNFYRQGKRVGNSELRIYDATGNIINKVRISDKAIGSQAKRQVGEWDLTDKNGRQVSEGTYLVKGVLKTSDGKSEKVSVILGVR